MRRVTRRSAVAVVFGLGLALACIPRDANAQTATTITTIAGKVLGCGGTPMGLLRWHCAGNADGLGLLEATFRFPFGMDVDANGNLVVCDSASDGGDPPGRVRIVSPILGSAPVSARGTLLYTVGPSPTVPLLGGKSSVSVAANGITDIAVTKAATTLTGAAGNWVIAARGDNQIKVFTPSGALVVTIGAGGKGDADGAQGVARFNTPSAITLDSQGNIYVADQTNHAVRKIDAANGMVSTVTGSASQHQFSAECAGCGAALQGGFADGTLANAQFKCPSGITMGANDDEIFLTDGCNQRVRRIDIAGNAVTTIAGNGTAGDADGTGGAARFNAPGAIDRDPTGLLYVADVGNSRLRRVTPSGEVTTVGRRETVTVDVADLINFVPPTLGVGVLPPSITPFPHNHFFFPAGVVVGSLGAASVAVDGGTVLRPTVFVTDLLNFRVREVTQAP